MITEITGLPGASKTLYTLATVKALAERENRPVFYHGINGLTLDWTEIDPLKWFECPAGAIIVIDECQKIFRPRSTSVAVPKHVSELETHRHNGHDLFLITQHPLLTDPAVRRLVGVHFHIVRKWGMEASTIHEYAGIRENCDKPAGRRDSIKHHWKFDRKVFAFYKSAELHTVKRTIPAKVFMFIGLPFLVAGLVYMVYNSIQKRIHPESVLPVVQPGQIAAGGRPVAPGAPVAAEPAKGSYKDAKNDAQQFVFDRTERVTGIIATAPRYDKLTEAVTVPVPSACVSSASKGCKCYSQQGTVMAVAADMCADIVDRGYFQDFNPNGRESRSELSAQSDRVPDDRATVGAPAASVVSFGVDAAAVPDKPQSIL